jgi:hypothetical protein
MYFNDDVIYMPDVVAVFAGISGVGVPDDVVVDYN